MKKILLFFIIFSQNLEAYQIRFNNIQQQTQVSTNRIKSFAQDKHGFLWIASTDELWRYDGYELNSYNNEIKSITGEFPQKITTFNFDKNNYLWIATQHQGLFLYAAENSKLIKPAQLSSELNSNQIYSLLFDDTIKWLGTNGGLSKLNAQQQLTYFPIKNDGLSENVKISSLIQLTPHIILVSTKQRIYEFNAQTGRYTAINLNLDENFLIYKTFKDSRGQIWIGTNDGLYQLTENTLTQKFSDHITQGVTDIIEDGEYFWVSSINQGLWQINKHSQHIRHFMPSPAVNYSLPENSLTSLFKDNNGLIWLGGFNGSVSFFAPRTIKFNLHNKYSFDTTCTTSESIFDILTLPNNQVIIRTSDDLFVYNTETSWCNKLTPNSHNSPLSEQDQPLKISRGINKIWLVSKNGIHTINDDLSLSRVIEKKFTSVYFIRETQPNILWIGTHEGLIQFNVLTQQFSQLEAGNSEIAKAKYYAEISSTQQSPIFATNMGLVYLNAYGLLDSYQQFSNIFSNLDTLSVYRDNNSHLWVGTYKQGLLQLDAQGQLIKQYDSIGGIQNFTIYSIVSDNDGLLWLGSDVGLIRFNPNTEQSVVFHKADGLQCDYFNINAITKSPTGDIYIGGIHGLNIFTPQTIHTPIHDQKPVVTKIKRFNEEVNYFDPKNELDLTTAIENINHLNFDYLDVVFGFEFSALNFATPNKSQYAFMLEGFDKKWNYVTAKNRNATYTNIPAGNYTFKLKATDGNGVWSDSINSINIKITPPPWLTWWALSSYFILFASIIYAYIQRKIKTNQRIASRLRVEVAEKTQELQTQKKTVEALLAKKNELFSHVSHEFRTPLTLILGPIKELLNTAANTEDRQSLTTINRSANRLLTLVEQLLQIARVSDFETIETSTQFTQKQVQSVVDSFQHMAQRNEIDLKLQDNQQAKIKVTEQFIDTVLGNLLSNAIKYTQPGGTVRVSAYSTSESFRMTVQDSGPGLSNQQQKDIFRRFKRLELHQSTEGIGIGLSVVEEVVNINNGEIKVESTLGVGSKFICTIPLSDEITVDQDHAMSTLTKQLQLAHDENCITSDEEITKDANDYANTVLIIEDNNDMRDYIIGIVKPHYNYLIAENGLVGVNVAIEQIPDIIISDVMMPEMDGFEVSRVIRSDQRTSHIPLMLLTSLDDKSSRIKGWRENIDAYMTKPFDSEELLVQLENMLTIRDILKKKAGHQISKRQKQNPLLPKKDQEFIDRLMSVIKQNYKDPVLNRAKIASKMAVSERQLQRKVKALIDQNPMEILREYRLSRAKKSIKEGYQISIVADECGFNSVSYFSQCFKAQYGLPPKQYQQEP